MHEYEVILAEINSCGGEQYAKKNLYRNVPVQQDIRMFEAAARYFK